MALLKLNAMPIQNLMTKLILVIVLSLVPMLGLSQGLVNFSGGLTTATRMSTNSVVDGPPTGVTAGNTTGGPLYYYALFASSSQSSINGSTTAINGLNPNYVFNNLGGGTASTGWVLVGLATNTSAAGHFSPMSQGTTSAGQGALNADYSMAVEGIVGGETAYLVVVGWEASIGTTLAEMENWYGSGGSFQAAGQIGQSAVATIPLGDGTAGTLSPFGSATGQVSGFVMGWIIPVPEPGTLALAALGGASLLLPSLHYGAASLFRRKK
ncbi:MAG: hypothetical protein P4N59_04765 [Negativicutes bacterium]|nr:hypothetical protein [Negativicutes bacterium]